MSAAAIQLVFSCMLVSHLKQFIFTKTSKTAGTSVEVYFEPYCLPRGEWEFRHARPEYDSSTGIIGYRGPGLDLNRVRWWNHMPAQHIRSRVGADVWDRYFKFTVVRNPFDKVVSAFHYFRGKRGTNGIRTRVEDLMYRLRWPNEEERDRNRFKAWVRRGRLPIDRDRYLIDGDICVDYFIRFERLEDGIRHVCDSVGIPFEPDRIPRLKMGARDGNFRSYYDLETAERVAHAYRFEMDFFGYEWPL